MKLDLNQIKLDRVQQQLQVVIFDLEGMVLDSCDSIFAIDRSRAVFDQFIFIESLREVFNSVPDGWKESFPSVEWPEGDKQLFDLDFEKMVQDGKSLIQWVIKDDSENYSKLLDLQQTRNEKAIGEEFALMQKRVAEMQKRILEFENTELERLQRFKMDFFAEVSHEMRTPLNSITGLVSLMEEGIENQMEYLPALKATSSHLNAIINDILDLSKIESGKLRFEQVDFDLKETMRLIVSGFQYSAKRKDISLELALPSNDLVVKGDPTRVAQILYNLLGNSVKFTETGAVTLRIKLIEASAEQLDVHFFVEDTGIGMEPSKIKQLLKPYSQASDDTTRKYGGTGLGLGIALKLVEAMGSELTIESTPGIGTSMSFVLQLPKGKKEELQESAYQQGDIRGLQLLIAEDDPVNQLVLQDFIQRHEAKATFVDNGKDLLDKIDDSSFDLILTDYHLPELTGFEVFEKTRAAGNDVPFLFISGEFLENSSELHDYEHWDFMIKPLNLDKMIQRIEKLAQPSDLPREVKVNLEKLREMVSGDEEFLKEMVQTILETLPMELEELQKHLAGDDAEGGRKVLHKIRPSIAYLGVPELSEERRWLHDQAEKGTLDQEFRSRVDVFVSLVHLALKDLENHL